MQLDLTTGVGASALTEILPIGSLLLVCLKRTSALSFNLNVMIMNRLRRKKFKFLKVCTCSLSIYFLTCTFSSLVSSPISRYGLYKGCRNFIKNAYVYPRSVTIRPKVIYTPNMYVARSFKGFEMCFIKNCVITNDSSKALMADGIVVNPYSIVRKSSRFYWNVPKTSKQLWIFVTDESPLNEADKYYDGKMVERFEPLDGLINFTISYRRDSDADLSYGRTFYRKRPVTGYPKLNRNYAFGRRKLAVAFISHCKTTSKREDYINILKKYIPIDVIGICGEVDRTCPKETGAKTECFKRKQYEYKFVIAFENSICRDYITEKVFVWLAYDIVPVVMGGGSYSRDTPPKSSINALDFDSPKALADYLIKVNKNDTLYNEYLQWKSKYMIEYGIFSFTMCNICSLLHNPDQPRKVYENFTKWWVHDAKCAVGGWRTRLQELHVQKMVRKRQYSPEENRPWNS